MSELIETGDGKQKIGLTLLSRRIWSTIYHFYDNIWHIKLYWDTCTQQLCKWRLFMRYRPNLGLKNVL